MNWNRVAMFAGIMFAATALAAFPFGFIGAFLAASVDGPPLWFSLSRGLAPCLAAAFVFAALAAKESQRPYEHAWAVWACTMLLSLPVNVFFLGVSFTDWLLSGISLALALFIGASIGRRLGRAASPIP